MMQTKSRLFVLPLLLLIIILSACNNNKVYDQFTHTPIAGWEKNDSVFFAIPKLREGGNYQMQLQLRTDNTFPFTSVVMILEQRVFPGGRHYTDTVTCKIADEKGNYLGKGINVYQYSFDVNSRHYNPGDSIRVSLRHDMKREMLPGIADVGLSLTSQP